MFHVLNRAVGRLTMFEQPAACDAFFRLLDETWEIVPPQIFAPAVMPSHWYFVVPPPTDDQVSKFLQRLTVAHTTRHHAHYKTNGTGHVYEGRFQSFPIQRDEHLLIAMRYVEPNPVRANFVELAEEWLRGSAYARQQPKEKRGWLAAPADPRLRRQWRSWVNKAESNANVRSLRHCIQRRVPFNDDCCAKSSSLRLNLESALRPRGRPRTNPDPENETGCLFCSPEKET